MIFDPRNYPLRSAIIVMAISSSIALLVTMSSLSVGVRESSKEAIDGVGSDIYVVPDSLNPLLLDLQRFDQGWAVLKEIESSPYPPSHLSPRLRDTLFYRIGSDGIDEVIAHGVIPGDENHFNQFKVVDGSWFDVESDPVREAHIAGLSIDNTSFTYEVMISEQFSHGTDLKKGDELHVSARMSSPIPMKLIIKGIFVDTISQRSESILMHLGELQYLKGNLEKDPLTEILLAYPDGTNLEEIISWSNSDSIPDPFLYNDIVDLYTREDFLSELYKFTTILDGFSAIVISVTLIVCLIFTSTIFMISTKERTVELSILRAIGFSPMKIFSIVIQSSVVYYIVGTSLGLLLGFLLNHGLNGFLQDFFHGLPTTFEPFRIDLTIIGLTVFSSLLLSITSGLLPAIISARRAPVDALRRDL
jgi:ABC-type antimicrobial peptide transport system permease subunit